MTRTFVGLGFGPIQSGLFLLEAQASGNFEHLVVVEVQPEIVDAVRRNRGRLRVNVANHEGVSAHELQELDIYSPLDQDDVPRIVEAIALAEEIATALPSVDFFQRGRPSPAELLAQGFERKLSDHRLPRAIVYAAENHNHAAERLQAAVVAALGTTNRLDDRVAFLNTVIGKMSGVVNDPLQIQRDNLAPLVEHGGMAVLVEEFNRILISRVPWDDFRRGIEVFQEKPELLPFEEAKLYGHNAAHSLLGFLAHRAGCCYLHDAAASLVRLAHHAFVVESGGALCHRHAGLDPLFSQAGWAAYAADLIGRMVNPHLNDRVERVIRDPRRKLAWNDRFIGTMRLSLEYGLEPNHFAVGAAAAAELLLHGQPNCSTASLLSRLWEADGASGIESNAILQRIEQACHHQLFSPDLLTTDP